jgi:hypothetical protein
MPEDITQTETPGEHLVQELLWIHGILRHDLGILSRRGSGRREGPGKRSHRDLTTPVKEPALAAQGQLHLLLPARIDDGDNDDKGPPPGPNDPDVNCPGY